MAIRIFAELGSTHMGKVKYAKEAIDRAIDAGFDGIKFQLFPNDSKYTSTGNIYLDPEKYLELAEYCLNQEFLCTASVFDEGSFDFLLRTRPSFIKFSYSRKEQTAWIEECLLEDIEAIVSCDIMSDHYVPIEATRLFCLPFYPVYFEVNFDRLFPRFDGFSDHTLGYEQTIKAVSAGAKIIEKHVTLNHPDINCPDHFFALRQEEWAHFIRELRRAE